MELMHTNVHERFQKQITMFYSKKILRLTVGVFTSVMILTGCNQGVREVSRPVYSDYDIPARVRLSLKGEKSYKEVEYHVDHINNRIYNSIYLPYGTKLDSAYLNMMVSSNVKVQIQNLMTNKTTDWSSSKGDSLLLDVKGGKLRINMRISDKLSKVYDLRILSYGYDPNKLTWEKSASSLLKPFSDMKVVSQNGQDYLFGRVGSTAELYRITSYEPLTLVPESATIPTGFSPRSVVTTAEGTVWGLTDSGSLLYSKDLKQWTAVNVNGVKCTLVLFEPLKGNASDNKMVVIGEASGIYSFYMANAAGLTQGEVVPTGFPVRGAYVHDYDVSGVKKAVVLGGTTKEGVSVNNSFFTSDGINWAPTPYSNGKIVVPMDGGLYLTSLDEKRIFLIGGAYAPTASKSPLKVSDDNGLTWVELTKENILGETMSQRTNAAGIIKSTAEGDRIYILGGCANGTATTEVWMGWLDTTGGINNAF